MQSHQTEASTSSKSGAFGKRRKRSRPGLICLQARILEVVAGRPVLAGTLGGVAARLNTGTLPLREALCELRSSGWIAVHPQPEARLTVRLERRRHVGVAPSSGERRRPHADAWVL